MLLDYYNIKTYLPEKEIDLVWDLYGDLRRLNNIIADNIDINKQLYLHYQDWHDEYSPERTDPCPDYYGTYILLNGLDKKIGDNMTVQELDLVLCTLSEYIEYLYNEKREA